MIPFYSRGSEDCSLCVFCTSIHTDFKQHPSPRASGVEDECEVRLTQSLSVTCNSLLCSRASSFISDLPGSRDMARGDALVTAYCLVEPKSKESKIELPLILDNLQDDNLTPPLLHLTTQRLLSLRSPCVL
ncbi:unnamed protein product [Pleuronectes platessa]|uniref:Uncharacterized protein n=1 Tax=Pleuronectes platessa TaxID=8262 RepID=A0A9N7VZS2_PLEPL|nr:unnamed protein product [Pleuronectes platessa]